MIIYKITNKTNNRLYIGQTVQSLKRRWSQHCKNPRSVSIISRSIRKYGKENFTIEQIDSAVTQEELNQKEIYWIKELNSLAPNGYNIKLGGHCGGKICMEERIQMSRRSGGSPFYVRELTTNEIMEFNIYSECTERLNLDHSSLALVLKNKGLTVGNYSASYKKHGLPKTKEEILQIKKESYIQYLNTRPFYAKDLITNEISEFNFIAECARKLNLIPSCIRDVLNKITLTSGNYTFSYKDEGIDYISSLNPKITSKSRLTRDPCHNIIRAIYVRNLNTNEIVKFDTKLSCITQLNLDLRSVSRCLKQENNYYIFKGYSFSYNPTPKTLEEIKLIKTRKFAKIQGVKPFYCRNLKTNEILKFETQTECVRLFGLDVKSITLCLKNKRRRVKDYSFSYDPLPPTAEQIKELKSFIAKNKHKRTV